MKYTLSSTGINNYMADLHFELEKITGSQFCDNAFYPIAYYVNTGRASTCFLKKMLAYDVSKLACILAKNMPVDKTIAAVKTAIRFC